MIFRGKSFYSGTLAVVLLAACVSSPATDTLKESAAKWNENARISRAQHYELTQNFIADPSNDMAFGYWNQNVAAVGREDLVEAVSHPHDQPDAVCLPLNEDPIASLVGRARQTNIVIINENHARPQDRLFVLELTKALRAAGYTHYAAETITETATSRPDGPTIHDDGYYTQDPVYGRVLNEIRQLGFTLVHYEQTKEQRAPEDADIETQIATREKAQVANLLANVLADAPDTRIIIHVGYAHANENTREGEDRWMADRLKEATGIDPLTISQTLCKNTGDTLTLATHTATNGETKKIFHTDYAVSHSKLTFNNGRPDYRRAMGDKEAAVPAELLPTDAPVLLEARPVGEPLYVVPTDRLFLQPGETLPLMLPSGNYEVTAFGSDGAPIAGPVENTVD